MDTMEDNIASAEYTCDACEKSFETEAQLLRHMREVGIVD